MNLPTNHYVQQAANWPAEGQHILAQYDAETIIVYQAYNPAIGLYAIRNGQFGGDFSYSRMSWIKPNFLWMMYRSGWATKDNQQMVLALRFRRTFFDRILANAVASSFGQSGFSSEAEWRTALADSEVRLQWDPDHDPHGRPLKRRAIQLGLKGDTLKTFGQYELLEIIDMTDFIAIQRERLETEELGTLETPVERIYRPDEAQIAQKIGLD